MNEETNTHLTDEAHIPVYTSNKEEYVMPNSIDSRDNRDYLEPIMEKQIWDAIHNRDLQRLRSLLFEPQFPKYQEHIVRHAVDSEGKKIDPMEYVGER